MRMRHSFVMFTAIVCLAFTFNACKKGGSDDNKPAEQPGKIVGMGENTGVPEGDQYVLPTGITVSGNIYGDYCDTTYRTGSGYLVTVCVALRNSKTKDTTIVLPAGLVILATNAAEDQHGLIIQETQVVLKANKITRVGLASYCINSGKRASSGSKLYSLGPVSRSPLIQDLIGVLRNKKARENEYADRDAYLEAVDIVQGLIWDLTDGDGTDRGLRDRMLADIPNR